MMNIIKVSYGDTVQEFAKKFNDAMDEIQEASNGTIDEFSLADNSVTTPKIVDGSVTATKLSQDLSVKISMIDSLSTYEQVEQVKQLVGGTATTGQAEQIKQSVSGLGTGIESLSVLTAEQSAQIKQSIQDINIGVENSSGTIIGSDGKKYKAVLEDSYNFQLDSKKLPSFTPNASTTLVEHGDICIVTDGGPPATTLCILDKNTFELKKAILFNTDGRTNALAVPKDSYAPLNIQDYIVFSNNLIFIVLRNHATQSNAQKLIVLNMDGTIHRAVNMPENSSFTTKLYADSTHLYLCSTGGTPAIRKIGIQELLDLTVSSESPNSTANVNWTNYNFIDVSKVAISGFTPRVSSFLVTEEHIFVVVVGLTTSTGYIHKYLKSDGSLVSYAQLPITQSNALIPASNTIEYDTNHIIIIGSIYNVFVINKDTLEVATYKSEYATTFPAPKVVQFNDLHTDEFITANATGSGAEIGAGTLVNGYLRTTKFDYVDLIKNIDSTNQLVFIFANGSLYIYMPASTSSIARGVFLRLVKTRKIIGYEEVNENVVISQ